jgi:hypothetical protein
MKALDCAVDEACPGGYEAFGVCSEEYEGRSCSRCASGGGGYYPDGRLCKSCADVNDAYLGFLLFVQSVFIATIAVGSVLLQAKLLLKLTRWLRILQMFVVVCQVGAQGFGADAGGIQDFFSFLSVVNWDVQAAKPGYVCMCICVGVYVYVLGGI